MFVCCLDVVFVDFGVRKMDVRKAVQRPSGGPLGALGSPLEACSGVPGGFWGVWVGVMGGPERKSEKINNFWDPSWRPFLS